MVISEPFLQQQQQLPQQQPQVQPQQQPQKVSETIVYVPKVAESSHIVLIPTPSKKTTPLRSGLAGPIPEELQDRTRFYCKKCHGNYRSKDELTRHEQNVCGKKVPAYICDSCDKTYYWPNPLREHYYKEHVKVVMYHCPRCNKPFNYSNKLSVHSRTNCPNKDGPEIYKRMIELDKSLEEKFKAKIPLEIENPESIQPVEQVAGDVQQEIVGGDDQQEGGVQNVGEGDEPKGGVIVAGEGDEPKGGVIVAGEGDDPKGGVIVVGEGNIEEYQIVGEQPQVTGEPLAQELLKAIQLHEEQQQPETQADVIIVKTDNVEEDDGEHLLDAMSEGIIPGFKDDEENGGQIKPEEDALLN